jgi:hypothetical protein
MSASHPALKRGANKHRVYGAIFARELFRGLEADGRVSGVQIASEDSLWC